MTSERPGADAAVEKTHKEPDSDLTMEHIRQALRGLRYGEVSIIVQDGVVIQVERTERKRIRRGER